jgi:hypothetical protein
VLPPGVVTNAPAIKLISCSRFASRDVDAKSPMSKPF